MNYKLGEVRKTTNAVGGLVVSVIAYILADETLSHVIPPQYVALLTGLLTVWRVFHVQNDPRPPGPGTVIDDVRRAAESLQASRDHAAGARDFAAAAEQQVHEIESVVKSSLGVVAPAAAVVTAGVDLADRVAKAIADASALPPAGDQA